MHPPPDATSRNHLAVNLFLARNLVLFNLV
jgi:hypothetical protein